MKNETTTKEDKWESWESNGKLEDTIGELLSIPEKDLKSRVTATRYDIEIPDITKWNKGQPNMQINWWKVVLITIFFGIVIGMISIPSDSLLGLCK